ncbi:MAG: GH3 auxin-responsive promoter family protein [Dehalococcoidia bacterium]|nr:GH3 auxin-responsive promoter family protein [Dehalococcoidia bacterium]
MPKVSELLQQGRSEELWQMCCGFLNLSLEQFMTIQKRLLLEQLELLNRCALGNKLMNGAKPRTIEKFRTWVPLTSYADYCPELLEKREDTLPVKPALWVRTSGKSGEYPCKWVPITPAYAHEMSLLMCGIGMLSSSKGWGEASSFPECPKIVYTVAPRPYTSGTMASMLQEQTAVDYLPPMAKAEDLDFEERIRLGFQQALSHGMDYFFGLSLILAAVGDKFIQSSNKVDIRPLLSQPKALFRLAKGLVKSKLARRPMLPKDLWSVKGIISSGLDSWVYRDKIKELWGRYPLDIYSSTEGGFIATQTWDCDGMTFIPNLNFLEFIPEAEHFKWQLDHSYKPKTVLLDEVKAGENYEVVITNFHGGALVRYRPGDMVRITSLRNEKLGIDLPQMVFERRADDLIDFGVTRLTEKVIWQAIENIGIPYEDWVACKEVEANMTLHLFIEPKDGCQASEADIAVAVDKQLRHLDSSFVATHSDVGSYLNFGVEVTLLPKGTFASYIARRRAEGAELAHLKPPHINPSDKVLSLLLAKPEAVPEVKVEAEAEAVATG